MGELRFGFPFSFDFIFQSFGYWLVYLYLCGGLFLLACMLYLFAPTFLFLSFLTMTKAEEAILRDLHSVLEWMWAF